MKQIIDCTMGEPVYVEPRLINTDAGTLEMLFETKYEEFKCVKMIFTAMIEKDSCITEGPT